MQKKIPMQSQSQSLHTIVKGQISRDFRLKKNSRWAFENPKYVFNRRGQRNQKVMAKCRNLFDRMVCLYFIEQI